jgi:hypothetical protein
VETFLLLGRSVPAGRRQTPFEPQAGHGFPRGGPPFRPPLPAFSLKPGAAAPDPRRRYPAAGMDLRRLRAGEWVAAASGVALLVSLFLPWYGAESRTAWESLAAIDVLLALVAASGVLLAIAAATQAVPAVPIALSALVTFAGIFGVLLVLFRVLDLPDGASGREWALWLGLAGAVGIVAGAVIAMREERAIDAAPVKVESLPAP